MKKVIIFILVLVFVHQFVQAETLGDLLTGFRYRIDETDSSNSVIVNAAGRYFIDQAQDKYVRMTGYLHKDTDIVYDDTTPDYALPSGFKMVEGVMVKNNNFWYRTVPNPYFLRDTNITSWFVGWSDPATARLYMRGGTLADGDTVRVFYRSTASSLDTTTDTCEVPTDEQVHIIDEAILMYQEAKQNFQAQQALWQQLRIDEGVLKTEGK